SFVSDSRPKRALCEAEDLLLRFPVLRFRVSLFGGSNLTRLFFVSVSGPNLIPAAFGVAFAFRRVHYFSRFPGQLIIEPMGSNYGMPNSHPPG
ncbi:hypothetical protein AB0N06_19775, partial [Streptomyces sp. NPDC051020]|uniref:hypothetical protein n=1 Tax=Streptomyces sp. NPDC051020 TaxID=3155409 RepID=UPI003448C3F1